MKIRAGFVSNSSSCSFTCNYCGDTAAGHELELHESDKFMCENNHIICISHSPDGWDNEDLKEEFVKNYMKYKRRGKDEDELYDLQCEAEDEYRWNIPLKFCPICGLTKITAHDRLGYLLRKNNISENDLDNEIKSKFTEYKQLKSYIKGV